MLKKFNTKVMGLAIAVGAVIGIIFFVPVFKSTPEKTLVQYTKALEKGDRNKIKKLLAPESQFIFEGLSLIMDDFFKENSSNAKTKVVVDNIIYNDDRSTTEVSYYLITESKEDNRVETDYETISMIKTSRLYGIFED